VAPTDWLITGLSAASDSLAIGGWAMPFQFLCPQGHVLQADESQVGMQCMCPYCGQQFLVPAPVVGKPGVQQQSAAPTVPAGPAGLAAAAGTQPLQPGSAQAALQPEAATGIAEPRSPAAGLAFIPGAAQGVLHIPCPSGHVLETPREMLGEDAICPFCQVQFRLRYENSIEYRKQRQAERERRELERGRAWMQWSFAIAAVVVIAVMLLIAASVSR